MSVPLRKVLKAGYQNQDKQEKKLGRFGYQLDRNLSNDNEQVYNNPKAKKTIVNVAGTHNLSDWGTDLYLGLGKLKDTNRYKEADKILKKAKDKYKDSNVTITAHSLGSKISQDIKKDGDQLYTLNGAYAFGGKGVSNKESHNFRTPGDIVSIGGANRKNVKTLKGTGKSGIISNLSSGGLLGLVNSAFKNHDVDTLKGQHIFI